MYIKKNMIGKKYGRLTVVNFSCYKIMKSGVRRSYWICKCECGNVVEKSILTLTQGTTKSCGCLYKELYDRKKNKPWLNPNAKPPGTAAFNGYYTSYKVRAKSKNRDFDLSKKEFEKLIYDNCYYCNSKPSKIEPKRNNRINGKIIVNGIDRILSDKGYTLDNCIPCCWKCNQAKMDMKYEEFIIWLKQIRNYVSPKWEKL